MTDHSKPRQIALWCSVVACLSVAVYLLVQGMQGPMSTMPDTPESAQDFACEECGHTFSLTPRKRARLMADQAKVEHVEHTSIRRVKLPCPSCKSLAAVVAASCPRCKAPFARRKSDGTRRLICPKCAEANQAADGER